MTQTSLIDTLFYGTFKTIEDISFFQDHVNCLNRLCTYIECAILNHFFYTLNEYWTMLFQIISTFTSLCFVEYGMSSSMCCLHVTSQQFPRPIPTVAGFLMNFYLLNFILYWLLQNFYATIAVLFSLEGFLGRTLVGIYPTHVSFSSLFVAAPVPRHWQQSVFQMCNCSYHSWVRLY